MCADVHRMIRSESLCWQALGVHLEACQWVFFSEDRAYAFFVALIPGVVGDQEAQAEGEKRLLEIAL